MEKIEYIDDYFKGVIIPEKKSVFEQRLLTDKDFAEEVAFYLSIVQVARTSNNEIKRGHLRELYYNNISHNSVPTTLRKLWPYAAMIAAALITLVVGFYLYTQPVTEPSKLADAYFSDHVLTMGVPMGNTNGLLIQGRDLYNVGNYSGSLKKFKELLERDTSNTEAKEYAGLAAFKLNDYKTAFNYFAQVAGKEDLIANPGKFYQALTLMKQNTPFDKENYKRLLSEVVKDNLFGKEEAVIFLKKLN